jgi:PTS system fructose-specific IIA component/PTS system nitrogen regulatory IIA component
MRMSEFVVRDAVIADLAASTKEGVIREMVQSLAAAGYFRGVNLEDVVCNILKRELLGSTGIGRGVAIPHAKHPSVERLIGTLAVSHKGIPFDSLDGEPVYVLVMLISPQDRPGDHLRALENVSRCLRDDTFVKALKAATTKEEIWRLLDSLEGGVRNPG